MVFSRPWFSVHQWKNDPIRILRPIHNGRLLHTIFSIFLMKTLVLLFYFIFSSLGNGMTPNRQQVITWTNGLPVHWPYKYDQARVKIYWLSKCWVDTYTRSVFYPGPRHIKDANLVIIMLADDLKSNCTGHQMHMTDFQIKHYFLLFLWS